MDFIAGVAILALGFKLSWVVVQTASVAGKTATTRMLWGAHDNHQKLF